MKRFNSLILMVLIVLLFGTSCTGIGPFDEQKAIWLAEHFMEEYNSAHVEEAFPKFEYVQRNDHTVSCIKGLERETVNDRASDNYYDYAKTDIDITDSYFLDGKTFVVEAFDHCDFHYHSAPAFVYSSYGIEFIITIKQIDGEYWITGIETDHLVNI